ncbi:hypothetical protein AVEN_96530-1 [Araneus ventricosus]|uniref:Uncharacterized protein n=1 Tax=Araneus ventricosus TaxID=182803 RepID=A0A4Y2CTX3_ARAVE|nr:hypothetical protein AVEN_96530-1 [Araneus ventricosus]
MMSGYKNNISRAPFYTYLAINDKRGKTKTFDSPPATGPGLIFLKKNHYCQTYTCSCQSSKYSGVNTFFPMFWKHRDAFSKAFGGRLIYSRTSWMTALPSANRMPPRRYPFLKHLTIQTHRYLREIFPHTAYSEFQTTGHFLQRGI